MALGGEKAFSIDPSCSFSAYFRLEDGITSEDDSGYLPAPPSGQPRSENLVQNYQQNSSPKSTRTGFSKRFWLTTFTVFFGTSLFIGLFWFNLDEYAWNNSQQLQIHSLSQQYRSLSQRLSQLYSSADSDNFLATSDFAGQQNRVSSFVKPLPNFAHSSIDSRENGKKSETNQEKRLPGALIIGARKCGTRALLEFLNLHPDIRTARYELHFFDNNQTYANGLEWYRSKMPWSSQGQITLEKTPAYFTSSVTPERVFRMNSTIKIILILRDPVIRTISDYTQVHYTKLSKNKTHAPFEQLVLDQGTGRLNTDYKPVRNSLYVKHLRRWLKYFPLKNVQIVDGDRFIQSPLEELRKIEAFLGIAGGIQEDQLYFNATKGFYCFKPSLASGNNHPTNTNTIQTTASTPATKSSIFPHFDTFGKQSSTPTKCLGDSKGRPHVPVPESVKNQLALQLQPFTEKFFTLANQRFDQWM